MAGIRTSGAKSWMAFHHWCIIAGGAPERTEKCLHQVELATYIFFLKKFGGFFYVVRRNRFIQLRYILQEYLVPKISLQLGPRPPNGIVAISKVKCSYANICKW